MLKFSKQSINKSDIKAVNKVLNSEYLTQGPKTNQFEKRLKQFTGAKYSIAVNSASSALLISCMALGLKKKILFGQYLILLLLRQTAFY